LIIRSFYKHKLSVTLRKVQATTLLHQVIVTVGEGSSKLGVLLNFLPIPLHDLLHVIGLGPRFHISILGLHIVCSALLSMVFCLDFSPFFFLLLFPCQVFFLYLSTYSDVSCHTSMYPIILVQTRHNLHNYEMDI
jgi:hypothetical protein